VGVQLSDLQFFGKDLATLSKPEIRAFIAAIEDQAIVRADQVEIPPKHHFSKGVYAREISIPKDTVVIGKIHKHQNLNILSQGEMLLVSVDGVMHVKAPYTIVSSPGVKRLALALSDCVWTTIHGTNETDIDKIENEFIAKTYDDVKELKGES
jgi:hypothetical protein